MNEERVKKSLYLKISTVHAMNEMRGLAPFSTFVEAILEDFIEYVEKGDKK